MRDAAKAMANEPTSRHGMKALSSAASYFTSGFCLLCSLALIGKVLNNCHVYNMFINFNAENRII